MGSPGRSRGPAVRAGGKDSGEKRAADADEDKRGHGKSEAFRESVPEPGQGTKAQSPRTRTRGHEVVPFQPYMAMLTLVLQEIELSAPVKRELGRCILSILVWILQRDTITQQDDLRETFLYRSFRNVDRVMMRVSRALPKLLELAIEDNETPTTISLTQQFVEQLAIVSDAVGLHTNFLDTLTRALARFQTEDLEIFFDVRTIAAVVLLHLFKAEHLLIAVRFQTLYSQSLKLQLARELILRIADVGPADSSITADGLVDVYLKAKPTGDGAKDAALWLRLVRLLVEMFRGYLILEAPTRTPDDTRKLTLRVATAVERMKYSKGTCLGRPMAPIVIRSDSEDEEMEEDEEGDIIDDWLDFIAEAPELLSMKV